MNTVLAPTLTPHRLGCYQPHINTGHTATLSELRPRFIEQCIENNPKQTVTIDIQGDLVELPVYTLRRRNALIHL